MYKNVVLPHLTPSLSV